jgi:signal transduction histidine kinase
MVGVSLASDWPRGWAERGRRVAALPRAPVAAAALLGALAVAEALWRAVSANAAGGAGILGGFSGGNWQLALVVVMLLSLATTLPLGLLWTQPAAAALAVSAASVLSLVVLHALTVAGLAAQLIAGYRLGRNGSRLLAVALGAPFLALALVVPGGAEARMVTVLLASLAPAAALAGVAGRARGDAIENSAARQVIAETLLEHTARGERARIARELHDVVAHHISMVAVQAETARVATPGLSADGAQRFAAIGDTARAALTEMRRLLGVLREDARADAAELRPQPGLTQLNELLDEARDAAGTGARLIVSGAPVTLDPGVELAAYRIVQEALTNARRHAPGAAVDVELRYTGEVLRVRIRDNGPGPDERPGAAGAAGAAPAGGRSHGLPGMRERAAAVGGRLRTGAAAGGGFLVEATLPARSEAPR